MKHDTSIINNYIQLAAAIVNSGIAVRDEDFLKSEWCQELIDAVVDFHNSGTNNDNDNTLHVIIGMCNKEA